MPVVHLRIALLASVLSACTSNGPGLEPVSVSINQSTFHPTDTIRTTLTNNKETLYANVCVSILEQRMNGRWDTSDFQPEVTCPTVLLPWIESATLYTSIPLNSNLQPGTYRVRFPAVFLSPDGVKPIDPITPAFIIAN